MNINDLILLLGQDNAVTERNVRRTRLQIVVNRRLGNRTVMSGRSAEIPLGLKRSAALNRQRSIRIDVTDGNVSNADQVQYIGPDLEHKEGLTVTERHRHACVDTRQRI